MIGKQTVPIILGVLVVGVVMAIVANWDVLAGLVAYLGRH